MKQHHDHLGIDSTVITSAPIGICVTDAHGYFVMVNAAYCALYGYREEELIGQHFTVVVPEQARSGLSSLHDAFIAGDHQLEAENEWEVIRKDGARLHILANAARITGPDDQLRKVTYVVNITERKELERRLEYLAQHDELTGLLNRRAGLELFRQEVARSRRYGHPLSIAICDLDEFKQVNDSYGHTAGDDILKEVAGRLTDSLRLHDKVIRKGGEEFLVLLPNTALDEAVNAIERLRTRVAATPMTTPPITQTLSAGVAELQADESSVDFLDRTDRSLYRAKDDGRNRVEGEMEAILLTRD